MTLTPQQFDLIDTLYSLDCDTRPCSRDDLALRLQVSSDAAHARMKRMQTAGLAVVISKTGENGFCRYELTDEAHRLFGEALRMMDPVRVLPRPDWRIEIPALLAAGVIGMEAA